MGLSGGDFNFLRPRGTIIADISQKNFAEVEYSFSFVVKCAWKKRTKIIRIQNILRAGLSAAGKWSIVIVYFFSRLYYIVYAVLGIRPSTCCYTFEVLYSAFLSFLSILFIFLYFFTNIFNVTNLPKNVIK